MNEWSRLAKHANTHAHTHTHRHIGKKGRHGKSLQMLPRHMYAHKKTKEKKFECTAMRYIIYECSLFQNDFPN